jgi:DNA-binding transcriptional ArsR family regulator
MKLYRKRNSFKPSVIKRNPALVNRFQRKKNRIKPRLLYSKKNQTGKSYTFVNNKRIEKFDSHFPHLKSDQLKQSDTGSQKNWWTPIWSGLVLDRGAKHRKAIKQAIWLYLYLLTVANRGNGQLFRKLKTIAIETGFHPRSVERWLKRLREKGYIETHSTGRFLQISITKWKPIARKKTNNEKGKQ